MAATYRLKVRTYEAPTPFVTVWLLRLDGAAASCVLWNEMPAYRADELCAWAESLGVAVERDHTALSGPPVKRPAPTQF